MGKKPTTSKFLKKHWGNILILLFIVALIIPRTRLPIQIFVNRLLSFEPSVTEDRRSIEDYRWPLRTLSGKEVNFSSSKNEVALVNFWATWCAPCIAEMPSFQALYEDYQKRVDFYFVSSDKQENIRNFMAENEYDLPVFAPLRRPPPILSSQTLPTTFLIDKNGAVVIKEFGTADWNSKAMRQILDSLLEK